MQPSTTPFTPAELDTLRAHGIVLFAQRVIFDAQAPLSEAGIDAIAARCAGPLPAPVRELWRQTAGGRMDYDLRLPMDGNDEVLSWSELFYDGSDGYRDLSGWIAHEAELMHEAAQDDPQPWDGRIHYLPIGGFEDLDRVYVVTDAQHPAYGAVLGWKQGFPPAWRHRLHRDSVAQVAGSLEAAFGALHLEEDPLAPAGDYFSGQALLEYLDDRHSTHGLSLELVDRLVAWYRSARLDWRLALDEGSLAGRPALAHSALRHAVAENDADLVRRLAAAGVPVQAALAGSATALDLALGQGAWAAAHALLDAGAPVPADALENLVDHPVAPELTERLLRLGAQPDAAAMARCVACAAPASARSIGQAMRLPPQTLAAQFEAARAALLAELEGALARVQDGRLSHYLGAPGLIERAEHLRAFEL